MLPRGSDFASQLDLQDEAAASKRVPLPSARHIRRAIQAQPDVAGTFRGATAAKRGCVEIRMSAQALAPVLSSLPGAGAYYFRASKAAFRISSTLPTPAILRHLGARGSPLAAQLR